MHAKATQLNSKENKYRIKTRPGLPHKFGTEVLLQPVKRAQLCSIPSTKT